MVAVRCLKTDRGVSQIMRRVKSILFLVLVFVFILLIPSPLSRASKSAFAALTEPLLNVSTNVMSGLSQVARIPRWFRESKERDFRREEFRRLVFEVRELQAENQRLQELLGFHKKISRSAQSVIPARVIGRSPAAWRNTIILNKGSNDNIRVNMPIITPAGLLGKVVEVTPFTSKSKLITDPQFRVGALIQRTRHTGVVYGTVDGECRMKYIALDADVRAGDIVQTAGLSETFPKGILIGTITEIWKEPGQIYKVASLELTADLDRLEEVLGVVR